MAQKTAEGKGVVEQTSVPRANAKSGKLVLIIGLVALIVTAQAVITYFLMPRTPDPKPEDPAATKSASVAAPNGEEEAETSQSETAEVTMGDYNCTNSTANPGLVVHIDFKLVAVAAAGSQASSLKQQLEVHSARVRQLVNQIVRRSSLEDLNDPNLSTIKRLIRQEVNRLLRKSYVIEVVISDIRTMEQ